jgi:UDP-N-acetylmuramoyl-L-alanyl-D-glutamate--2,6-diaminopimelate ligase
MTPAFDPTVLTALNIPIKRLCIDSRRVRPGDIFAAAPGLRTDGRVFIPQAIAAGAAGVLWETNGFQWGSQWRIPNLGIDDLQAKLGLIAAHVYGDPSRNLWVAGVTGTNGKTSCTHWIAQSLGILGRPTGVIGTLGIGFPGELRQASHTTADPVSIQEDLAELFQRKATGVAMEVSSHGLDQGRVNGVSFSDALFTNLSRDHLDYHGTMERYGAAKAKLFDWPGLKHAVINLDDRFGLELAASVDRSRINVLGYGFGKGEISGHRLDLSKRGLTLEIETPWGPGVIRSQLLGGFNASNLLGVVGMLLAAGVKLDEATGSLERVHPPAGRLQMVRVEGRPLIVVDYAHSPDALEKVLEVLRSLLEPGAKLVCVFGCGGDRDKGKRPLMGEVATRLSHLAIITSDNPRSEDPHGIIEEITGGAHPNYVVEEDRAMAIARAVREAGPQDLILIAGKGHESYQEIAGTRLPFSDAEVARVALERSTQRC